MHIFWGCCWLPVKCVLEVLVSYILKRGLLLLQDPEKTGLVRSVVSPATHRTLWRVQSTRKMRSKCWVFISSIPEKNSSAPKAAAAHSSCRTAVMSMPHLSCPGTLKGTFFSCSFLPWICNYEEQIMSLLPSSFSLTGLGLSVSCGHKVFLCGFVTDETEGLVFLGM